MCDLRLTGTMSDNAESQDQAVTLVTYRVDAGVATIELDDAAHGNALSLRLAADLLTAVERAASDPDAAVVVLQAGGRNFCVGGDVFEMHESVDRGAHLAELTDVAHRAVLGLFDLRKPVIAAVQGAVAGGGMGLALVADIVVVDEGARFVFAYPAIGVTPDCGTSWLLPWSMGARRALQFALFNEPVPAVDAVEVGLATELVPAGTAQVRAREIAERVVAGAPAAAATARQLLRGDSAEFAAQLDRERQAMIAAVSSERSRELIDAFVARARSPRE